MGVFGDTLRQARAHKGVTLREAEQATRISRHYLLALEEEHFEQLPALIYQRGIVKNYASYLDLDQAKLLRLFGDATGEPEPASAVVVGPGQTIEPAGGIVPNFAVVGFVVVMLAVVFAWGYSAYVASPADPQLTQSPPTPTALAEDDRFIPTRTAVPETPSDEDDGSTGGLSAPESGQADDRDVDADQGEDAGDASGDQADDDAPSGEIVIPSTTATSEPMEITFGGNDDEAVDGGLDESSSDDSSAQDETDEAGSEEPASRRYAFYATQDVTITIVADNVTLWEGNLAAGTETPFLDGESFLVSFSGGDELYAVDDQGNEIRLTDRTTELP